MSLMVPIRLKQPVYASTLFSGAFGDGTFPVMGIELSLAFLFVTCNTKLTCLKQPENHLEPFKGIAHLKTKFYHQLFALM